MACISGVSVMVVQPGSGVNIGGLVEGAAVSVTLGFLANDWKMLGAVGAGSPTVSTMLSLRTGAKADGCWGSSTDSLRWSSDATDVVVILGFLATVGNRDSVTLGRLISSASVTLGRLTPPPSSASLMFGFIATVGNIGTGSPMLIMLPAIWTACPASFASTASLKLWLKIDSGSPFRFVNVNPAASVPHGLLFIRSAKLGTLPLSFLSMAFCIPNGENSLSFFGDVPFVPFAGWTTPPLFRLSLNSLSTVVVLLLS
uniref:(northern house mosquito) hypothetical protein n=1 Tax=Culex pipiens TaxID=7175 RepID=A0A8D8DZA5_CULPI